jgi:hypothetical protein
MGTSIDLAVDTSALTAILLGEREAPALLSALTGAANAGLCVANRAELLVVVQTRLGELGVERAKQLPSSSYDFSKSKPLPSMRRWRIAPLMPIAASVKADIRPDSTSGTASPTPWRLGSRSRYFSKGMTSR